VSIPAVRAASTDEAVLAESLSSPESFGELYSRYFDEIYRYMAGRLGPDAADDLAAETFLAAFRRRSTFDPGIGAVRPVAVRDRDQPGRSSQPGRIPPVRGASPGRRRSGR
jgi:Sigma-70 region 2